MPHLRTLARFFLLVAIACCSTPLQAPIADPGVDQTNVTVGSVVRLDGSKSSDPQGLPLLYGWTFAELPIGSEATLVAAATSKPYFKLDVPGHYRVQLIVSNGVLASPAAFVSLDSGSCGTNLPVVDAITATPAAPNVGQGVTLSASVSDADAKDPCKLERTFSYAWKITDRPAGSSAGLVDADTPKPSFKPDLDGDYEISAIVTDQLGRASAPKAFKLTVGSCGNQTPVIAKITANPDKPAIGQVVALGADVSDKDSDCGKTESIGYGWTLLSAPPGSNAALNLPSGTNPAFHVDLPGAYVVRLVATDLAGHKSAPLEATITASACGGNAPSIDPKDITVNPVSPGVGAPVQLGVALVSDADTKDPCNLTETFSFQWQLLSLPLGSKASLNLATAANPSFTPDVPGDYLVSVVATDSEAHPSGAQTVKVTASTCGNATPVAQVQELLPDSGSPGAKVTAVKTVAIGSTVQVSGGASSDADNAAPCLLNQLLGYKWSFQELPAGSAATLNATNVVNPSFVADVAGKYVLALVVADPTNRTSPPATFTITADPAAGVTVPSNFSIATIASGGPAGFNQPRGVTEDGTGAIYVVMAGTNRVRKIAGTSITTVTQGQFITNPTDIAYDGTNNVLFVSASDKDLIKVTLAGVQTSCQSGGGAKFRGLQPYNGSGGLRLAAADFGNTRVDFINPANCTIATTNNLGALALTEPWGVAAALIGNVDSVFVTDRNKKTVLRNQGGAYMTNAGANAVVSNDPAIADPRDVVVTPANCAVQKLVTADFGAGQLHLFANAAAPQAPAVIVDGLKKPVGLYFEDSNNLLVTDETLNALIRISGDFCSL